MGDPTRFSSLKQASAPDSKRINIAIIGGGISGLAAAFRLLQTYQTTDSQRQDISLTVFEASERLGGIINTLQERNSFIEEGPDSFVTFKPGGLALCSELGLSNRIISTNKSFRRAFVAWNDKLEPIPEGFMMIAPTRFDKLFKSQLFSQIGKLRMSMEQFIPAGPFLDDESVASFVTRRFGKEALSRIGQPLVGGIYTADPERLSLRSTLPKYREYEQRFGSVTAGLLAERLAAKQFLQETSAQETSGARYGAFISFDQGMSVLVQKLVERLRQEKRISIETNCEILSVKRAQMPKASQWSVHLSSGEIRTYDQIIFTTPAFKTAELLSELDQEFNTKLREIKYASSAVLNFLFDRGQIKHALDGFGFVVPSVQKRSIIAASFSNVKFSQRCPENQVLIRVFIGGAIQDSMLQKSNGELIRIALDELDHYLQISGPPINSWIKRWQNSMPQFAVGHYERIAKIQEIASRHFGLYLCGAYLNGVGIPDCIESANKACEALAESLKLNY